MFFVTTVRGRPESNRLQSLNEIPTHWIVLQLHRESLERYTNEERRKTE